MKKFKKCFFALFLSCFLAFGNLSGCYLEVQAIEWVSPEVYLPFTGAMPYLMGLLGVFPENENSINWDSWREDYEDYLVSEGLTVGQGSEFSEWVQDISDGSLNQASVYWDKFKSWLKSKVGASSVSTVSDMVHSVRPNAIITNNYNINVVSGCYAYSNSGNYTFIFCGNGITVTPRVFSGGYGCSCSLDGSGDYIVMRSQSANSNYLYENSYILNNSQGNVSVSILNDFDHAFWFNCGDISFLQNISSRFNVWDVTSSNDNFNVVYPDLINDFSLALQNAISSAIPDVIPLPWEQLGDTTEEIENYLEGIIDAVNEGVLSLEDAMSRIQTSLGVVSVDVSTGVIYPQNPDKPDETLDDRVQENQANGTFVLGGFEKVFPFCIPFDIYAFMTLLVAEPVAPVIEWPVYNPISKDNEIISIDFSTWNDVVVLFRYIFDFLFIIGLLLSARALIGGGDKA